MHSPFYPCGHISLSVYQAFVGVGEPNVCLRFVFTRWAEFKSSIADGGMHHLVVILKMSNIGAEWRKSGGSWQIRKVKYFHGFSVYCNGWPVLNDVSFSLVLLILFRKWQQTWLGSYKVWYAIMISPHRRLNLPPYTRTAFRRGWYRRWNKPFMFACPSLRSLEFSPIAF